MKILLAVGFLVLVLVMFKGNVQEGLTDSQITTHANNIKHIGDANSSEKHKPMKDMKLNWDHYEALKYIIGQYANKGLSNNYTIQGAIDKLNQIKNTN